MDRLTSQEIFNLCTSKAQRNKVDALKQEQRIGSGTTLHYVPWMDAHKAFSELFPGYSWRFLENAEGQQAFFYPDGTAEVRCEMTVRGISITTSLPVRQGPQAVKNPNAMQINTAKQRCRVKCMAEFGWGSDLWEKYEGDPEDLVVEPEQDRADENRVTETQADTQWNQLVEKVKTPKQLRAAQDKFANWCRNTGREDDSEARAEAFLDLKKKEAAK